MFATTSIPSSLLIGSSIAALPSTAGSNGQFLGWGSSGNIVTLGFNPGTAANYNSSYFCQVGNNLSDVSNKPTALTNIGAMPIAGGTFTGSAYGITPSTSDNSTLLATTSYVKSNLSSYQGTITLTTTGTSGAATLIGNTLNVPQYAGATYAAGMGLTLMTGTFSVNTSQNISTLSNLTSNGFVKTSGGTGALSIDTNTYVNTNQLGVNNGVATLNSSGQLTSSQIPSSLVGAVVYQGTWNASTNSPTLASGTGTKGSYYKVSVAGTTTIDGISSWNIGDTIIFDGTVWDKIDGVASEVVSVAGRTGAVTLTLADIGAGTNTAALVIGTGGSLTTSGSGTITATAMPASGLTGSTLPSGIVTSSLTSVGTLGSLTVTGTINGGLFNTGTLGYTDTGILASFQSSVNSYNQVISQNSSNGSTASSDFIVSNNNTTATTYYGDFGINSSGFTGAGSFNQPNYVYLSSTSGDLAIGTTTNNAIHFVVNNTDYLVIGTSGAITTGTWQGAAISPTYITTGTSGANIPLLNTANTWSAQQTFALGTITASAPITVSQTWNNAAVSFIGGLINITPTASNTGSYAFAIQNSGTNKFTVDVNGNVVIAGTATGVTATTGDNSTKLATTQFVTTAVANGGGGGGTSAYYLAVAL